jgi:magnesium transporter
MTMNDQAKFDEALAAVRAALDRGAVRDAIDVLERLRPPDQADVFEELDDSDQVALLPGLEAAEAANLIEELENEEAADVAERLDATTLAHIIDEMEPDEAADLLGDLNPDLARQTLAKMAEAADVRPLLIHADDSAGGLMTSEFLLLRERTTVQEAIQALRAWQPNEDTTYYLFVVNQDQQLRGVLSLRRLIIADPHTLIGDIMNPDPITVKAGTDQEEVAHVMSKYDLLALPVVDEGGHMLGVITHDDVIDVIEDEAGEDMLYLGGVLDEERVTGPVRVSVRQRLPWLYVNLFTAFLAAGVIGLFEGTIQRLAVLAAFQSIVAGQGGNAGTQTLTVVVRSLALDEIELRDVWRVILKELAVGLLNGLAIGAAVGAFAYLTHGSPVLGLIIGVSMVGNMLAAGFAGALIPLLLKKLKLDPALGSGVIVTTVTDVVGFGLFLGLATIFIQWLT